VTLAGNIVDRASFFMIHILYISCLMLVLSVQSNMNQVRPFSGTDVYPHMPILRPHAARFHEHCISSVTLTSAHLYGNVYMRVGVSCVLANWSDYGLLGEQSSQKFVIPWLGRTNTQKNSKRYIYLHVWIISKQSWVAFADGFW